MLASLSRPTPGTPGETLDEDLAGLDALEIPLALGTTGRVQRAWDAMWPKFGAFALILLAWQVAVWAHWKPFILQTPGTVARQLVNLLGTSSFWTSAGVTFHHAVIGFGIAIALGAIVGTAVTRVSVLRAALGSLITGMQTMPSVLWFPLAVMVFGLSSNAIVLMIVLGSSPAIANGFISGIDQVPPGLTRAGRILGARGFALQRHVVLPAALPVVLGSLKQGWAFAWHALMAGEFLIQVAGQVGLGGRTENAQTQGYFAVVVALMIVIVIVGIVVNTGFNRIDLAVRHRYGLIDANGR